MGIPHIDTSGIEAMQQAIRIGLLVAAFMAVAIGGWLARGAYEARKRPRPVVVCRPAVLAGRSDCLKVAGLALLLVAVIAAPSVAAALW